MASSVVPLPSAGALSPKAPRDPKLMKTATDFETVFLETSFGHLFSTVGGEGPMGGSGTGGETYRSMLTQEYARSVTRSGGVGIADTIYRELVRLQEGTRHG